MDLTGRFYQYNTKQAGELKSVLILRQPQELVLRPVKQYSSKPAIVRLDQAIPN